MDGVVQVDKCHRGRIGRGSSFPDARVATAGLYTEMCVAGTYFSASERGLFLCLAHGALVGYGEGINEATEKILNTVSKVTVERFLDGKQEYLDPGAC